MSSVRSIHVIPAVSEAASGPTYFVMRLGATLSSMGDQAVIAALDWAPLAAAPGFLKTFPVGWGPRRLGRSPVLSRWLHDQCSGGHVDLVHNHGMWQLNSLYPAWSKKNSVARLVSSPHGSFSPWAMEHGSKAKRVFWPLLQRPALNKVDCFHATAHAEYHDIRRLGFRQPVAIIPIGIDLSPVADRGLSALRTLLFLGRVHPVKGLDNLLAAWRLVQDHYPAWQLVIAGGDDGYYGSSGYLQTIHRQAADLGLVRLKFAGPLYGQEKMAAYANADLFVLPSYTENFAVTVAEALANQIPCIVSKGAPWPEIVKHRAGWWIDIGVEPLAHCLTEAMSLSPTQLAEMGHRGREWMERDFSWDSIGTKMAGTYRWLCDQSLPVPPWVRLD